MEFWENFFFLIWRDRWKEKLEEIWKRSWFLSFSLVFSHSLHLRGSFWPPWVRYTHMCSLTHLYACVYIDIHSSSSSVGILQIMACVCVCVFYHLIFKMKMTTSKFFAEIVLLWLKKKKIPVCRPGSSLGHKIPRRELAWGGYKQWLWNFCSSTLGHMGQVGHKEVKLVGS